ncbi:unnamed protein product [Cuscuta campestris]|uniref:Uncharacterized protein n=1 Tax=Cuscuta campestris TaxID=132261 RepID=A0A484M4F2_9ASTE|nr:unnamed protein product [Cuscuta campestris]
MPRKTTRVAAPERIKRMLKIKHRNEMHHTAGFVFRPPADLSLGYVLCSVTGLVVVFRCGVSGFGGGACCVGDGVVRADEGGGGRGSFVVGGGGGGGSIMGEEYSGEKKFKLSEEVMGIEK